MQITTQNPAHYYTNDLKGCKYLEGAIVSELVLTGGPEKLTLMTDAPRFALNKNYAKLGLHVKFTNTEMLDLRYETIDLTESITVEDLIKLVLEKWGDFKYVTAAVFNPHA